MGIIGQIQDTEKAQLYPCGWTQRKHGIDEGGIQFNRIGVTKNLLIDLFKRH